MRVVTDADIADAYLDLLALEAIRAQLTTRRKDLGHSQRALAQVMGVPQSYVSKLEIGSDDVRLSTLQKWARALGATIGVTVSTDGE